MPLEYITISIDAMSGDHGVTSAVPAAVLSLKENSNLKLLLVGQEDIINAQLKHCCPAGLLDRIVVYHASEIVEMDDLPAFAMRNKKDSSMRVAINLVKEGVAGAVVSAGNTGALMATARFVLKMIPGIDRPAICSSMPSTNVGNTHMMDLGANVDSSAEHLYQFAQMGSVLCAAIDRKLAPRIGLLNIGEEDIKGNEQVKKAAALLNNSKLNYIGYVEGNDIFSDVVDVVICDGFVGNVSLKTTEGLADFIKDIIKSEFKSSFLASLMAVFALPVLNRIRKRLDSRGYNGASLLGLKGIVIKSHGGADTIAFKHAIDLAVQEVKEDVPQHIARAQHLPV